jgi:chromate transporter
MAIHIGHERAGWKGLIVAGFCFIVPAVLITGIFAWLYKDYGQPAIQPFLYKTSHNCHYFRSYFSSGKEILKTVQLGIIGGCFASCAVAVQ